MMHLITVKLFPSVLTVLFCLVNILSFVENSTPNDPTPDYLENLLNTNNFKEFINIVQIPYTDLVNPAQRKTLLNELYFYNGLELGDILLRPGQILNPGHDSDLNEKIQLSISKWKNGIVPYYISKAYADNQTDVITSQIQYTNQELGPNINFRPYQNGDDDYVFIFNGGSGCYANLGNVGGPQVISLSEPCLIEGFVAHELQHVLGIAHEHNRIDRDKYVEVKLENIPQVLKSQYEKYTSESLVNLGPFDYYSIMFYPVKTPGFDVTALKLYQDGIDESRLGAEKFLAPSDIKRVKTLYS